MHIRKQRMKNGRVYLSLVQSYRDEDGKPRSRYIRSLGYLDVLEKQYDDPIAHFEAEVKAENERMRAGIAPIGANLEEAQRIDMNDENPCVEMGAAVPSAYYCRVLGLRDFFESDHAPHDTSLDLCGILEFLVWDRIAHPSSKREAWERRGLFPRDCGFSLDDIYRSLAHLAACSRDLIRHINASLDRARGPRNRGQLFYKITDYYFEVGNGFQTRDVPAQRRADPFVQMGLLLDADGIPLDYELFLGNRTHVLKMLSFMDETNLKGKQPFEIVIVADRECDALNCAADCARSRYRFVLPMSMRHARKNEKKWVLSDDDYVSDASGDFRIKSRISDTAVRLHRAKSRYTCEKVKEVAFWSRDRFEAGRYERAKALEMSRSAMEHGHLISAGQEEACYFADGAPVACYGADEASFHKWVLDETRIAMDEAFDGYGCIITNNTYYDDRDTFEIYFDLAHIKDSFRVLNDDARARPSYVSREDYIRAHFLVCYVAFLIMRLMQKDVASMTGSKTGARAIAGDLARMIGHHLSGDAWLFDYRTELTDALCASAGIDLSHKIMTRSQMINAMSETKGPMSDTP